MPLTPILTAHWDEPDSFTLEGYRRHGGYDMVPVTFGVHPDEVIALVKDSGLRGRGGAGFPTGMKWGFVPQNDGRPHYLVVNADESEPGACKDIPLMLANPHALVEGCIHTSYAIRANHAFIYIRGEVPHAIRRVTAAVREAYAAGLLGKNILGSGFDLDIVVHSGAGAYICGEETALLDSLEGKRGNPRLKPPFPAIQGLYGGPTLINNVETLMNLPNVVNKGSDWFKGFGTEKSPGTTVFGVSGLVQRPGLYELPLGTRLDEIVFQHAGGPLPGRKVKGVIPGGMSMPILPVSQLDVPMANEFLRERKTMLGTGGVMVLDDTTCMVRVGCVITYFFRDESCGQCVPCRIGTVRQEELLARLAAGRPRGTPNDELALLRDLGQAMRDASICGLGQTASSAIESALRVPGLVTLA